MKLVDYESSAPLQDANDFGNNQIDVRHVMERDDGRDPAKRLVAERQVLGSSSDESQLPMLS